jgi:hypothetical protein
MGSQSGVTNVVALASQRLAFRLTGRTNIDTVICVQTADAEIFFHNGDETSDALRIRLSPVFSELRKRHGPAIPPEGSGDADVIERLQQLADMRAKDLLTAEEFEVLKAQLLGQSGPSTD